MNTTKQIRRLNNKAAGLCRCGNPLDGIYVTCLDCREADKRYRKEHVRRGLCYKCFKPRERQQFQLCNSCNAKNNVRTKERDQRNYFKRLAKKLGYNPAMLQDSFKKQSVCPYSGRKLEVGRNLSLDHRIAKSNGGTNDLDNLQWVDRYVNLAKHDMSENDFLALVKDIYDYRIAAKRKP